MRVYADLLTSAFPVAYEDIGQNVIINRGFEINRIPGPSRGVDAGNAVSIPHAYFLHNVVPTARGFSSLHYVDSLALPEGGEDGVDFFSLRSTDGSAALFIPADGQNYFFSSITGTWSSFPISVPSGRRVTVAHLKNNVFICYEGYGLYVYNFPDAQLERIYPWGIEMEEIIGVSSGNNYLLLHSNDRIYWTPEGITEVGNLAADKAAYVNEVLLENAIDIANALSNVGGGLDAYKFRAGNTGAQIQSHYTNLAAELSDPPVLADVLLGSTPQYRRYVGETNLVTGNFWSVSGTFTTQATAFAAAEQDYYALKNAIEAAEAQADALYPTLDSGTYSYYMDFRPDLITGAGSTQITAVRGEIITVLSLADGFIAYTKVNATAGVYSGNAEIPFVFREVPNSAGVLSPNHVAQGISSDTHIVWSPAGFQQVSFREAQIIWPELGNSIFEGMLSKIDTAYATYADYIESPTYAEGFPNESYESLLNKFNNKPVITAKHQLLDVRLAAIGSRYITISVKDSADAEEYFVAYIYDIATRRFGRLGINHSVLFALREADFFSAYSYTSYLAAETAYEDETLSYAQLLALSSAEQVQYIGVFSKNSAIRKGVQNLGDSTEVDNDAHTPRLVLGKYKAVREQGVQLTALIAQPKIPSAEVKAILHDDASNEIIHTSALEESTETPGYYYALDTGESISVQLTGDFDVASICMDFNIKGGRKHSTSAR